MPTKKKAPHTRSRAHARKKNPLYVVTNEGSIVEEATGLFDALVKRFNLGPVIGLIETIIKEMALLVTNYQMFTLFKEWLDQWIHWLMGLTGTKVKTS